LSASFSAVLLAAGRGRRLKNSVPKAYLELDRRPLLWYSLREFALCAQVSQIVVVIHREDRELFERSLGAKGRSPLQTRKRTEIVYGGEQRQDSALAGVLAAAEKYVLLHDAARPLISAELLTRVIEATQVHSAAVPALPITDSLKRIQENEIVESVDREELVRVQTPQGFRKDLILHALQQAHKEKRYFTDEAGALLALLGVRAKIVPGEELNVKVTTPSDLELARLWLSHVDCQI
jgi:2-C-methyl-D-erythritol 4-phosphate cytidylyltransferase